MPCVSLVTISRCAVGLVLTQAQGAVVIAVVLSLWLFCVKQLYVWVPSWQHFVCVYRTVKMVLLAFAQVRFLSRACSRMLVRPVTSLFL